jgi:prepilin-type N-terminal cleavage/methylation domain-containing protein
MSILDNKIKKLFCILFFNFYHTMIKSTKKAFTLVELIVVITILAILGTIAFISLQGYSADARNTKRANDVSSIAQKISIEIGKGQKAANFADLTMTGACKSD